MNPALRCAEQAFESYLAMCGGDRRMAPGLVDIQLTDNPENGGRRALAHFRNGTENQYPPLTWQTEYLLCEGWPWPNLEEFVDLYERMCGRRVTIPRRPIEIVNLAIERINPPPVDLTAYAMQRIRDDICDAFLYGISPSYQETVEQTQRNHERRRELAATEIEARRRAPIRTSLPQATWRTVHRGVPIREVDQLTDPYLWSGAQPATPEEQREAGLVARKAAKKALRLLDSWLTTEQRHEFRMRGHFHVIGGETKRRYRIKRGSVSNVIELGKNGKPLLGHCFTLGGNLPEGDVMLAQKLSLEHDELETLSKANFFMPHSCNEEAGAAEILRRTGERARVWRSQRGAGPVTLADWALRMSVYQFGDGF